MRRYDHLIPTDQLSRAVLVQELPLEPASQLGFALRALLLASFSYTGAVVGGRSLTSLSQTPSPNLLLGEHNW